MRFSWWLGCSGWVLLALTWVGIIVQLNRKTPEPSPAVSASTIVDPNPTQVTAQAPPSPLSAVNKKASLQATNVSLPEKSVEMQLRKARQLLNDHEPEKALDLLLRSLDSDKEHGWELEAEIGRIYSRHLSQAGKAVEYFEKSLLKNPNQSETLQELVGQYSFMSASKKGGGFLKELENRYPNSTGVALAIADYQRQNGKPLGAARELESKSAQLSQPWEGHSFAGALYLSESARLQGIGKGGQPQELAQKAHRNFEQSIQYLERWISERQRSGESTQLGLRTLFENRVALINSMVQLGRRDEAIRAIDNLEQDQKRFGVFGNEVRRTVSDLRKSFPESSE